MGFFSSCIPDIAIVCIWPDYPIAVGGAGVWGDSSAGDQQHPEGSGSDDRGNAVLELGHAGILLIRGTPGTAETVYYEFGRYRGPRPTSFGNIRKVTPPQVTLDSDGDPTKASLKTTLAFLSRNHGRNTSLHGNVSFECGGFDKAAAFADIHPGEYGLVTNSCMIYAQRVNAAGGFQFFNPIPVWNSNPSDQRDFGLLSNYVLYNPERDRITEAVWKWSW